MIGFASVELRTGSREVHRPGHPSPAVAIPVVHRSTREPTAELGHARRRALRREPRGVSSRLAGPALASLLLLALPSAGTSQGTSSPILGDLALDWARGRYATPLVCEIDGEPVRGVRRLLIAPAPNPAGRSAARIIFVDLEPGAATRCFDDFGEPEPNIKGSLEIHHVGGHHPESARRDFKEALRRNRGFDFVVGSGQLQLQKVGPPPASPETIDFTRGSASLRLIAPGSDAARLLADFGSPRKLLLKLRTREGRQLDFPLFLTDLR